MADDQLDDGSMVGGGGLDTSVDQSQQQAPPQALAQSLMAGMGNGMGPNIPQQPSAGVQAARKHGGLLTGLVGVLLDGLSAGVRTPQGPQGFSQSAQMAAQMPMQRQQQQMALKQQQMQFGTQQELQKAQIAQAHVQQLQARLMAASLDDEVASGMSDAAWKFAQNSIEQGTAKSVSGLGSREAAFDKLKELHDSSSAEEQGNLFAFPSGKDKDGNQQWGVYQVFPNKTLQEDTKFHLDGDPDNGIADVDMNFPAGTPMSVYTTSTTQATRDHVAKLHTIAQQNKQTPTKIVQRSIGGEQHNIMVDGQTGKDIKDLGPTRPTPQPTDKNDTSKADRRAAETEVGQHFKTYSNAAKQADDILGALDQAGNGNQVAAAIAPLENTLFITSQAGIKRVNHTELDMNMPGAGSKVRAVDAWLAKKITGALPEGYVKDLRDLVNMYKQSNEGDYKSNVDSVNTRYNTNVPYGLKDGGTARKEAADKRAKGQDPFAEFGGKSRQMQ